MQTIHLDVSASIYDNVMFFLNNLPKKKDFINLEIEMINPFEIRKTSE